MKSDQNNTSGQLEIEGQTYRLGELDDADFERLRERIKTGDGDPIEVAKQLLPLAQPAERQKILDRAYQDAMRPRYVTPEEIDLFRRTVEGACFTFWLAARKDKPELTEEEAARLLKAKGNEAIEEAVTLLQKQFPDTGRDEILSAMAMAEEGPLQPFIEAERDGSQ